MPPKVATGYIVLETQMRGLKGAEIALHKSMEKISSRTSYYAGFIQARMGMMALAISSAMVGAMVGSTKAFIEFEKQMINTSSVMDMVAGDMERLTSLAEDLGRNGTISATRLAESMYYLGSAGASVDEVMQGLEPIWKLAIATQSDLNTTALTTMNTLRAFGKDFDHTARFAQVFVAGITQSQLTMETLSQSLKFIAPITRDFNIEIEDAVAMLAMLADQGIKSGMAGRSLRRMLQATEKQTVSTTKVLHEMGLQYQDIDVAANGFGKVLDTLSDKGLTVGDVFKVFGLRASASVRALQNSKESFASYLETVSDKGKLQSTFEKQMASLDAQILIAKNSLSVLSKQFGEIYKVGFVPAVKGLRSFINWMIELGPKTKVAIAVTGALSAATLALAGSYLILQGVLTQSTLALGQLIQFVKLSTLGSLSAIKSLILGTQASTIALNKNGMAYALVATQGKKAGMFVKQTQANMVLARTATLSFTDSLVILAKRFFILVSAVAALIVLFNLYTQVLMRLEALSNTIGKAVKDVWTDSADALKKSFEGVFEWINKKFNGMKAWAQENPILGAGFNASLAAYGKLFEATDKVTEKTKELSGAAGEYIEAISSEGAKEYVEQLKESAAWWSDKMPGVSEALAELAITIEKTVGGAGKSTEAAADATKKLGEEIGELDGTLKEFDTNLKASLSSTIFSLLEGTKTWKDVWKETLDSIAKTFIDGFVQGMVDSFSHGLAEMLFNWKDTIAQMGNGGSSGGGFMSWFSNIFSLIGGASGAINAGGGGGGGQNVNTYTGGSTSPVYTSAEGGIFTSAQHAIIGESGTEAVVPLNRMNEFGGGGDLTIINVIDQKFVTATLRQQPGTVVNIINEDIIKNGSTRKTIKNYSK